MSHGTRGPAFVKVIIVCIAVQLAITAVIVAALSCPMR
jgi:hypothetical protein